MNKQIGAMTVIGDDPRVYAAALVEYSKVQVVQVPQMYSAMVE